MPTDPQEDAIIRFILENEGDRCPSCSSPAVRTVSGEQGIAFAHCLTCDFTLETQHQHQLATRDLPEWVWTVFYPASDF